MRAPEGTLISYATQPGNVAQDGADGHSPYTKALAATIKQSGLDIFQTFIQVGLAVKRETGGSQQPWVSSSPIDGTFYFVAPPASPVSPQAAVTPPPERLANTLRPDPDRIPIKDQVLLRELSDRLYEHNFDPEPLDSKNGMRVAIRQFQQKTDMTPTGEPTEGVLTRLRKLDDLKPWGSIVYGPDSNKFGISWKHASRRAAVDEAQGNCGGGKCPFELSFYGTRCGAPLQPRANPGRWFSATPCSGPRMPRLTGATRLANLAALSMPFAPMDPAVIRIDSPTGKQPLCKTRFNVRSGLA
jgi:hypothetical protein